jgi:hypothetical protein
LPVQQFTHYAISPVLPLALSNPLLRKPIIFSLVLGSESKQSAANALILLVLDNAYFHVKVSFSP